MISAKVIRKQLIKKYPEKLKEVNGEFLPKAGFIVSGDAKLRINNVTGNLSASIKEKVDGDRAIVGTSVEYAPYVEYGTVRSRARPYLRPALDENRKKLINLYRKIFKKVYRG